MKETWESRIKRAEYLGSRQPESSELLTFYAALLRAQQEIYEYLRTREGWLPSGSLEDDLKILRVMLPTLLKTVESRGPEFLAAQSRDLQAAAEPELDQMLIDCWRAPSDVQFFGKAFLQPYACWLSEIGAKPVDRSLDRGENRCPFCGGKPQVGVLRIREASESGGRDLVCSMCLTAWEFRRVVCAGCGEENPANIAYFQTPDYPYLRIEACDTCKLYIKGVDLTKYGLAIPIVDEIAGAPLDLWAREHGYTKIEMNLVGV